MPLQPAALAMPLLMAGVLVQSEASGWKLPAGGFVELTRKRSLEPPQIQDGLLRPESVPGFHTSEVGKGGEIELAPADFRDLPTMIGWSLSSRRLTAGQRTRVDRTIARVFPLPAVRVKGAFVAGAESAGIWTEAGEFEVSSVPFPEVKGVQGRPSYERLMLRGEVQKGRLQIDRKVDLANGRVVESRARLSFTLAVTPVDRSEPKLTTVTFEETLNLSRVLEPRYQGFQADVDQAIERGARFVRSKLADPNERRFEATKESDGRTLNAGHLALAILTLLKAEASVDDPVLTKAVDELRRREIADTYSLSCALMALEAVYAPPNERDQLLQGLITRPRERKPAEADRRLMEGWLKQLLKNVDLNTDRGYRLRFSYLPQPRFDNSCTQYAALGIYSAQLCGLPVDAGVWNGLAEHFVKDQRKAEGAAVPLSLLTYREQAAARDGRAPTRAVSLPVKPRGWAYVPDEETTGSMTCAGITGLLLAEGVLSAGRAPPAALLGNVDPAIRAGLAWLSQHYTVRGNPARLKEWYFYALYSLERACELGGIARLGDRDWYFDGCMQILRQQGTDGGFPTIEDACFAVLFLKKAQLPVRTGSR